MTVYNPYFYNRITESYSTIKWGCLQKLELNSKFENIFDFFLEILKLFLAEEICYNSDNFMDIIKKNIYMVTDEPP